MTSKGSVKKHKVVVDVNHINNLVVTICIVNFNKQFYVECILNIFCMILTINYYCFPKQHSPGGLHNGSTNCPL